MAQISSKEPCEYCKGEDSTPVFELDFNKVAITEDFDLQIGTDWDCFYVDINFCPMCARPLREKTNENEKI